jgi:hypothetical protein
MALPDFGRKAKDLIPQLAKPPTLSVDTSGAGAEGISPGLQRSQIKAVERPLPDLGAFYLKGDIQEIRNTQGGVPSFGLLFRSYRPEGVSLDSPRIVLQQVE